MSENSSSDESKSKRAEARQVAKASQGSAEAAATRRLKRVAPCQKESKLARLSRARRANNGPVKHPRDLLGVSLADGRYVVKSPLGKGSMAYVFRASDARLQTDVVLKVPKPEKVNTADFRERFQRESQLLIRFSHPHVVKVLDVGEYAELPYVVMQLLKGGSLSDRIARESDANGCMTPDSLKTWVREVARALDFCYRKGMVHRDVKPANILFDEDNNAYVGDFGLSKIMCGEHSELSSDETAAGVVLGTPNYISPEVVQGKDYDGRSDQYSLGITIYHVLTGGPPMQGNTATMTMLNQTQRVLPLLSDVRSEIPRPLAVAVRKAIEKKPERRFNTCVEFAEAVVEGLRFAPLISTSSNSSSSMSSASTSSRKLRAQSASGVKAQPPKKSVAKQSASSLLRKKRKAVGSQGSEKKIAPSQRKARRNPTSARSSQQRMKTASSASSLEADMDWFDMDRSGDELPGRSSSSSRSSSRSSGRRRASQRKPADSKLIWVFGQQLHPTVLVGLGIFAVFSFVMVVWSPWAAEEFTPELVAGQYQPDSLNASVSIPGETQNSSSTGKLSSKQVKNEKTQPAPTKTSSSFGADHQHKESKGGSLDPTVAGMSLPDRLAAAGSSTPGNADDSGSNARSPMAELLVGMDSIPLFNLPVGTLTKFGDGTAESFVCGRSIRSRKTGEQTALISGDYKAEGLATLSHDGNWFAATTTDRADRDYNVRVWNTKTGEVELEVSGDGRRKLRNLFLSDQFLYLETDRTQLLQVWSLISRRQQGVLPLPAERLRTQRMGMTREGSAFAALVNNQLSIIHGLSGVVTTKLDSPLAPPVQVAMANASTPLSGFSPGKMLQSLSGIQFSNDQLQLAAIRTSPETALMTWNDLGHLQYDLPFAVSAEDCQPHAVQWFDKRSAWLAAGSIIDAKHRRVVVAVPHDDGQRAMIAVQDDDHLMTTLRTDVANVYRRRIPWEFIDDSLGTMSRDENALLKPGATVQLLIDLPAGNGTGIGLRPLLENAVQQRLAIEEVTVADDSPLRFKLTTGRGLHQNDEATILELVDSQSGRLIWYAVAGPSLRVDAGDFRTHRAVAEAIAQRISKLAIPYYVPSDSHRIMLPYFIDE